MVKVDNVNKKHTITASRFQFKQQQLLYRPKNRTDQLVYAFRLFCGRLDSVL